MTFAEYMALRDAGKIPPPTAEELEWHKAAFHEAFYRAGISPKIFNQ